MNPLNIRTWLRAGFLSIMLCRASAFAADSQNPKPEDPTTRAVELVAQLGSPSFDDRQAAAASLRELGLVALAPLRAATEQSNLEIAARARRLLVDIERLEQERRIAIFLKSPNDAPDDLLPGLKRFRETVGRQPEFVPLFIEMQRAEPALFQAAALSAKDLESTYELRTAQAQFEYNVLQNRKFAAEKVCALLFMGADPDIAETAQSTGTLYGCVHWNEFRTALTKPPYGPAVRRLLGNWIRKPSDAMAYQKLMLGLQMDIPDSIGPAIEVCKANQGGGQKQYAILAIGRFGTREHIPVVEKLLTDTTLLSTSTVNGRQQWTSEMRDVVLATLLHLTNQEPKDYGLRNLQRHPQYLFAPNTAGFEDSARRTAALKKWEEWRAANPAAAEPPKP